MTDNYIVFFKDDEGNAEIHSNLDENEAKEIFNHCDDSKHIVQAVAIKGVVLSEFIADDFFD